MAYTGEVEIILRDALERLAQDEQFDEQAMALLWALFDEGKLHDETQLKRGLAAIGEEAQP